VPELFDHAATVPAMFGRAVARNGSRELIVTPQHRLSYTDIDGLSARLARRLLLAGVGKGTRVGLLFPQGPDWVVSFLAAARIGALTVTISTFAKPAEIARTLRQADVHLLLTPATLLDQDQPARLEQALPSLADAGPGPLQLQEAPFLRAVWILGDSERAWATPVDLDRGEHLAAAEVLAAAESEVTPADLAVVIFTSGTTSEPKGVVHTHGAITRHGANLAGLRWQPHDVTLALMPFFWVGGIVITLLPAMHTDSTLLTIERFDASAALELMEREHATAVIAWWTMSKELFSHPDVAKRDLTAVRPNLMATPSNVVTDPGLRHNSLGMTETCGPHSTAPQEHQQDVLTEEHRGSHGPAVPGVQRRIADPETGAPLPDGAEGEICIQGYSTTVGLYKREREETFDADGWFHTGDRGYLRDGFLFFTGRSSDMIKSKGANVAPKEVEGVLLTLPGIKHAVVIGLPHPELEEEVAAALVRSPGQEIDLDAVRAHVGGQLASYKIPRRMVVLEEDEMPMLPTGKLDKRALTTLLASQPS
jgi:acyl-CoA synthetase (AMP-forming)/AMP-acid ligase II